MGKHTGFTEFARSSVPYRDPLERLQDFSEIFTTPDEIHIKTQGARCMDCGVPFCQSGTGCPIDNLIPEWNDLVYKGRTDAIVKQVFGKPNKTQGGWLGYTGMNITNAKGEKYGIVWFGIAGGVVQQVRFDK